MSQSTQPALSPAEVEHFITHGYVVIKGAIDPAFAREQVRRQFAANGMDAADSATWSGGPLRSLKATQTWPVNEIAPRFFAAACQLLGGIERLPGPDYTINNGMTCNLGIDAGLPWAPPTPASGWHKDGYFFRHFLDSPEQALLALPCWSDVVSHGGATYFAPDSIGHIARHLAAHPEGVHPNFFPYREIIAQCPRLLEAVGTAGDLFLMHGYMLHTVAANPERKLRCISNMIVALGQPLQLHRPDGAYSPLETAVLRGLGVAHYKFQPTRPRLRTPDWSPLPNDQQ